MDDFNSDDHYTYYCGQESLKRNGVVLIVNKNVQNSVLGCKLKWTGMGEFNSDDDYTCYCGQESLRRNGVAITVNKRV